LSGEMDEILKLHTKHDMLQHMYNRCVCMVPTSFIELMNLTI
jgi:hypothetical protein